MGRLPRGGLPTFFAIEEEAERFPISIYVTVTMLNSSLKKFGWYHFEEFIRIAFRTSYLR
jgi:hypothetical protein